MLLGIKWHQSVRNDEVRRLLTAIVQSRHLTLFGHIARMDDNTDAKRILSTLPPGDWRRPRGRPSITWLSIIQQDLKSHISHCLKQWIWHRTGLRESCGRRTALRNFQLQARNDDDDDAVSVYILIVLTRVDDRKSIQPVKSKCCYVRDDDLNGALHMLELSPLPPPSALDGSKYGMV